MVLCSAARYSDVVPGLGALSVLLSTTAQPVTPVTATGPTLCRSDSSAFLFLLYRTVAEIEPTYPIISISRITQ
jgi:hypothetical protein